MSTALPIAQHTTPAPIPPPGAPAPAPNLHPMGMGMSDEWWSSIDDALRQFMHELAFVLSAAPEIPSQTAYALHGALMMDGDPVRAFLAALGALLASTFIIIGFRYFTRRFRMRGLESASNQAGAIQLLAWGIADRVVFIAAVVMLGRIAIENWGNDAGFTKVILRGFVVWYALMLFPRILFRPDLPRFRLIPLSSSAVRPVSRMVGLVFALGMLGPTLLPLMIKNGMMTDVARCLGLIFAIVMMVAGLLTVRILARGLIEPVDQTGREIVAGIASFAVLALGLTWSWSIVMAEFHIFWSLLSTVGILSTLIVLDFLLGLETTEARRHQAGLWRGTYRFAAGIVAALWIGHIWFASTGALPWPQWRSVSLAIMSGGATLFIGFLIWQLTNLWAEKALGVNRIIDPTQVDEDELQAPASRLATFFPMARVLIGFTILLIAVMVALSDLGVNVAPLLAGAGVFGLAISFGSQSLIKDILSGVFFMADDAFRVGEYIDTGRLKGTVEKISLRSLRLRHQNGQVHTIPYGQLQSITNFSRDWATMKFTLRIDPTSDLELVRKTVKKVGLAMMEDPELGKELLQPVKLQGIQEIQDNALVVRIKFTARPNKPTWVQREALKRIILAFRENGIKFAANAVTIAGGVQAGFTPEMAAAASTGAIAAGLATSAGARFPTATS